MQRIYTILFTMMLAVSAFAEDVKITLAAPTTVEAGDKFRVQFKVNSQEAKNFNAPDFKGFEVIYGPSTSTQSSFQIINGHTTQSSSVTYTFVILAAMPGTYTLGPATATYDGKTIKSNTISIKVLPIGQGGANTGNSSGTAQGRQSSRPVTTGSDISTKDLFMTATASRTNVYEQEAILLTYKIYTLVNLIELDGKLPTLDGFQIQEIPLPRNKEFQIEQYNGRNYRTVIWSQYVLFPQKEGNLVIPSITYEGTVVTQNRAIDPIDAFFNGTSAQMELKKKITTPRLNIKVSALPNKPADFSGGVGSFTLSSSVNTRELLTNDALTLKVQVKGHGNMKLLGTPIVEWPKDFETYDAKINDNFSLTHNGLQGAKEFEFLAVPRHAGTYTIPPVKFIYFDPANRSYKTLTSEAYTITVKKGSGSSSQAVSDFSGQQQDVRELGQDIRYIKTGKANYMNTSGSFFGSLLYIATYLIIAILAILAGILGRKYIYNTSDSNRNRVRKANKQATKRLKKAEKLLSSDDRNAFYDEVLKALNGYISDKLGMPLTEVNKENLRAELSSRQVSDEDVNQYIRAMEDCEFARYAPGDPNAAMEQVFKSATDAISRLDGIIK